MKIVKSNYIKEINNKYTLRIILQNEKIEKYFDRLFELNRSITGKDYIRY